MNYCNINDFNKSHLKNLIKWLIDEVNSAGGDGDAMWYSQYFKVGDLLPLLKETFEEQKQHAEFRVLSEKELSIYFGDQADLFITNNLESFNNRPSYQQCSIVY